VIDAANSARLFQISKKQTNVMNDCGADSKLFEELTRDLLERGIGVRFRARGASMSPAIRDGEIVEITPVIVSKLRKDDIVLAKSKYGFRLHRIVYANPANDVFVTRGDCGQQNDPALTRAQRSAGRTNQRESSISRSGWMGAAVRGARTSCSYKNIEPSRPKFPHLTSDHRLLVSACCERRTCASCSRQLVFGKGDFHQRWR
jgi:hypothetical protein